MKAQVNASGSHIPYSRIPICPAQLVKQARGGPLSMVYPIRSLLHLHKRERYNHNSPLLHSPLTRFVLVFLYNSFYNVYFIRIQGKFKNFEDARFLRNECVRICILILTQLLQRSRCFIKCKAQSLGMQVGFDDKLTQPKSPNQHNHQLQQCLLTKQIFLLPPAVLAHIIALPAVSLQLALHLQVLEDRGYRFLEIPCNCPQ